MPLERLPINILPDSKRVIVQFFTMGEVRARRIVEKILALSEEETSSQIKKIKLQFGHRHKNFEGIVQSNYMKLGEVIKDDYRISQSKKFLIGAYFSREYSIEAAALFNPSIVVHPDQSGTNGDEIKFVMSLRATGDGHISSVEFREGKIKNNEIILTAPSGFCQLPARVKNKKFDKEFVKRRLNVKESLAEKFLTDLKEEFTIEEFKESSSGNRNFTEDNELYNKILDILESNYEIEFDPSAELDERVIFPATKSESVGIEDVRFVKFHNDDGSFCYYGTYTAYNGKSFRVQLFETTDFKNFRIRTLHGSQIQDKGMALFPRKVNGKYVITSRNDGENLYIMFSDNLYNWNVKKILYEPHNPFELIQVGNCGSPIETKHGWLLITHAVGYFRRYSIGAMLLDTNDPSRIIGVMNEPLIEPVETERDGYVPNVVYSCGSMTHKDNLIIPFAMSDSSCGFARIPVEKLISKMKR